MSKDRQSVMKKLIEELQRQIPLKETTVVGDTVIIVRETDNSQVSVGYARVIGFERDLTKRDEWWHVHFVFLEVPPQMRTIILQTIHFTGREIFTMGGRKVFIKAVNFDSYLKEDPGAPPLGGDDPPPDKPGGKPTFTLIK
jgi:hypothetical protein